MRMQVLLVLAVGVLIAAEKPKADDSAKELKKFDGTWVAVSIERGGEKVPADELKVLELVIAGGKFTVYAKKVMLEGTLKVNPGSNPKSYEATLTDDDGKKTTSYGIYEIKGDTLKVCYTVEGKDQRPKEFKSKEGSKTSLAVYKRKKTEE